MIKQLSLRQLERIRRRFQTLYGSRADQLAERFYRMVGRYGVGLELHGSEDPAWSQNDVFLITYADSIGAEAETPLRALHRFASRHLKGAVRTIHLLPFFPWSSDDGFSVVDYREVDPACGKWEDVEAIGRDFRLMFDVVLNHCSSRNQWFRDFLTGIAPARWYFLQMDAGTDLSAVVRPRTSPLLSRYLSRDGECFMWTTFSADQVDLNWQNPDVLFEFLDILFWYLSKGARVLRLDAVAFLWKEIGTSCLHLPQTHEVVKLLRDVCELVADDALILTETNVPHAENVTYFGEGDEAHMVYNFSLPPLLLHALLTGNGTWLTQWASELEYPAAGCTYFNFTASHDGVGVRPMQGLGPADALDTLVKATRDRGGHVSMRTGPDGTETPYELNITFASILEVPGDPELSIERFLCSQALALSLKGIPAVYLHSLFGTLNDVAGAETSGIPRRINRSKFMLEEINGWLAADSRQGRIFSRYQQMLRRRSNHPAFHPDGQQRILDLGPALFAIERLSPSGNERLVCLFNLTAQRQSAPVGVLEGLFGEGLKLTDVLNSRAIQAARKGIALEPYRAAWLAERK